MHSILCFLLIYFNISTVSAFGTAFSPDIVLRPDPPDELFLRPHRYHNTSPFYKKRFSIKLPPTPNPFEIKNTKDTRRWSAKFARPKPVPKPLTRKQQIILEKFETPPRPHVPRDHKAVDRLPLQQISVGQKFLGKVIAVTE